MAKVQNVKAPIKKVETEEKEKAILTAMEQIEKKFGNHYRFTIRYDCGCPLFPLSGITQRLDYLQTPTF